MAKTAKTDRQAKIDQIRSKQKGAERRRGMMIVGVCVVIAVLIVGAAAYRPIMQWWELRQFNDLDLAAIGVPASDCQDVIEKAADGNQEHVQTGTPVQYEDAPPAFGAHWNESGVAPAPMERKLYSADDRPELESLVHNLEHGYTILWYDDTIKGAKLDELKDLAVAARKEDAVGSGKFIVSAWDDAYGDFPKGKHVALSHWGAEQGHRQLCGQVSGAVVEDFVKKFPASDAPEPNAA